MMRYCLFERDLKYQMKGTANVFKKKLFSRAVAAWRWIPLWTKIIMAITLASCIIHYASVKSPEFAGFFNYYVAGAVRALLSTVMWIIPFSFAELLILLLPVMLIVLIVVGFKLAGSDLAFKRIICGMLSVLMCFYSIFVWTFATGYRAARLDERLELVTVEPAIEPLYETAHWLMTETNRLSAEITYGEDGASIMPYSLSEMSAKLGDAMDVASDEYGLFFNFPTRAKPVLLSRVMSRAHITGIYTFFTGESNLNVDFPDYTLPHTAAHEFSHQRGISREDEANFVAFLICVSSDDPYIQYSGYLNMFEYTVNTLHGYDPDAYGELIGMCTDEVRGEMIAYGEFFEQYRDTTLSEVSDAVNDATLKLNGTEGTISYSLVVNLAISYHNTKISDR